MQAKVRTLCALAVVVALATVVVLQDAAKEQRRVSLLERNRVPRESNNQRQQNKKAVLDEIVRKELELQQIEDMENTIRRGSGSSANSKIPVVPAVKAWSNPPRPRIVVWRAASISLQNSAPPFEPAVQQPHPIPFLNHPTCSCTPALIGPVRHPLLHRELGAGARGGGAPAGHAAARHERREAFRTPEPRRAADGQVPPCCAQAAPGAAANHGGVESR